MSVQCLSSHLAKSLHSLRFQLQAWELHKIMLEGLESGEVQPLPFTIFSREQTEDAFRYLSKGNARYLCKLLESNTAGLVGHAISECWAFSFSRRCAHRKSNDRDECKFAFR